MKPIFIATFTLLLFQLSFAQPAGSLDPSCSIENNKNPYELPTRIGRGSLQNADQCIDTQRFRPAVLVSETQEKIIFANFRHENQYWQAELSLSAEIETTFFQVVQFEAISGVTAAHTQIRFRFQPGSELVLTSFDGKEKTKVNDLVVSVEASRPKDVPYNFALGSIDNYVLVWRLLSGKQRVLEDVGYATEQYSLNLNSQEALMLIAESIKKSDKDFFSRFYNTLLPNCTTEIFNLIDQLPSQQIQPKDKFLTVISNDPIAGPSLKTLEERGLLNKRYANLEEEIQDGAIEPPVNDAPKNSSLSLLPEITGLPYSLVIVTSQPNQNKDVLRKAKSLVYKLLPSFTQIITSQLMIQNDLTTLLSGLNQLTPLVTKKLKEINSDLGDEPIFISFYLAPWDGSGQLIDVVTELNLSARLPFETYQIESYDQFAQTFLQAMTAAISLKSQNPTSFGLLSLATQLSLIKDQSSIGFQVVGHLGPQSIALKSPVVTSEATIKQFIIPNQNVTAIEPLALLHMKQNLVQKQPELSLEFGPLSGIGTSLNTSLPLGEMSINPENCQFRSYSTPRLDGEISIPYLEFLGKWKSTQFHIRKIDFDLSNQSVKKVYVDVKPIAFICLADESKASEQFTQALNQKIQEFQNDSDKQNLGLFILEKILSSNEPQ